MTMLELIGHHKTALRAVVDRQPAAMEGLVAGLVSVAGAPSSVAVVTGPAVGSAASPAERAASGVERSSSWKSDGQARALLRLVKGGRKLFMPFGEFQLLRPELIGCCVLG